MNKESACPSADPNSRICRACEEAHKGEATDDAGRRYVLALGETKKSKG